MSHFNPVCFNYSNKVYISLKLINFSNYNSHDYLVYVTLLYYTTRLEFKYFFML